MFQKITLLVCAFATVLSVVHSAPNQLKRDTSSPQAYTHPIPATYLPPASTLRLSNEPERLVPAGQAANENPQNQPPSRTKRAIIFRPLFVYRQQEIKKQKLKERREQQQRPLQLQNQQQQQSAACAACQQQPHHQTTRKPVRYYAQQYPYQRW